MLNVILQCCWAEVKGFIASASVIERKTLQILVQGILTEGEGSVQLTSL
jgi:hypothetical protein